MGGWGSGRFGYKSASTVEETRRVDIRYIRKQGWLYDGRLGSLSWKRGGEPSGSIAYRIKDNTFTLDYKVRESGSDEWQELLLPVQLTVIPMRYGGNRYYFTCPVRGCSRRCEVLYSAGVNFVCRICAGVIYGSQKGTKLDQILEAKHKLGERIFAHYDYGEGWGKRRGMHWKTYHRLRAKYQELENAWALGVADRFGWEESVRQGLIDGVGGGLGGSKK